MIRCTSGRCGSERRSQRGTAAQRSFIPAAAVLSMAEVIPWKASQLLRRLPLFFSLETGNVSSQRQDRGAQGQEESAVSPVKLGRHQQRQEASKDPTLLRRHLIESHLSHRQNTSASLICQLTSPLERERESLFFRSSSAPRSGRADKPRQLHGGKRDRG